MAFSGANTLSVGNPDNQVTPKPPKLKRCVVLPVAGDGGCLFTSLRLALELRFVLEAIQAGAPPTSFNLDGNSQVVVKEGVTLRQRCVCPWFKRALDAPLVTFGMYVEGPNARPWTRGDLIARELANMEVHVPDELDSPERRENVLKYLAAMERADTWGGQPEYTAVAHLSGLPVDVYEEVAEQTLAKTRMKSVEPEVCMNSTMDYRISLMFSSGDHYSCLVMGDDWQRLCATYGTQVMHAMCNPRAYLISTANGDKRRRSTIAL